MDEMRYEAMVRRIVALEARVAVLEKRMSRPEKSRGVRELREKFPIQLSKTDASKVLGVTRATVYAMIEDGRLEENAAGKVTIDSLIELLTGPAGRKYKALND